jgi:hypothetical protein
MKRRVSYATDIEPDRSVRFLHPAAAVIKMATDCLTLTISAKASLAWFKLSFSRTSREQNGNQFCGGN